MVPGGQVGQALTLCIPQGMSVVARQRAELDITNPDAIAATLDEHKFCGLINAAAYTAVDQAESDVAGCEGG